MPPRWRVNTYVSLVYELKKKLERYLRVNLLGPGPRLMKKEFTGAAVSQGLRNTALNHCMLRQADRLQRRTCICPPATWLSARQGCDPSSTCPYLVLVFAPDFCRTIKPAFVPSISDAKTLHHSVFYELPPTRSVPYSPFTRPRRTLNAIVAQPPKNCPFGDC